MFANYRSAFSAPGARAFSAAGFIMRMPIAMYPIGLVLLVSIRTGHYSFAGVLSSAYVFGSAAGSPVLARMVDRRGQRALLLPATSLHLVAVAVLGSLAQARAPDWTMLGPAAVAGFAYLPVTSLVRARWSYVLAGSPALASAYSIESTLDEIVFVIGPLVATVVATDADPVLVLVVTGVLVGAGAVLLRRQRTSEPPPHPPGSAPHESALRARGMPTLVAMTVFVGAVFSTAEVTMVAFCSQHGHRGASGLVLSLLAAGSAVSGFGYGSRTWRTPLVARARVQAVVFGGLTLVLLLPSTVPALAACAFVLGLGIAPTLITAFGLVEHLVASRALTEGLTWVTVGLSIGFGTGSAVAGQVADAAGARAAFALTVVAGAGVAVVACVLHRVLLAKPDGKVLPG